MLAPLKIGEYFVKSGYHEIRKNRMGLNSAASTSGVIDSSSGRFIFIWKVYHNILPLRENLWKKKVVQSKICPICHKEDETIEHALLLCDWTRPVWYGSQLQVFERDGLASIQKWLEGWFMQLQKQPQVKDYGIMILCCSL